MLHIKEEYTENPNKKVEDLMDDFAKYLDKQNIAVDYVDYSSKTIYVKTIKDLKEARYELRTEFAELKQLGVHILSSIGTDGLDKDYKMNTKTQTEKLSIKETKLEQEQELIDYRLECADFAMYEVVQCSYVEIVSDNTNGKYEVRYNNMTVTVEFILDLPGAKYCYMINDEGPHCHDSYEYIRSDIMDYIDSKLDESCYSKKSNIKEDFEPYTYVKSKTVYDSDGWTTEYTMYYDEVNDRYVFVFGDSDYYNPNDGYEEFDWECDTEREANDWFNNYNGFEDDLDESIYKEENIYSKRYFVTDDNYIPLKSQPENGYTQREAILRAQREAEQDSKLFKISMSDAVKGYHIMDNKGNILHDLDNAI